MKRNNPIFLITLFCLIGIISVKAQGRRGTLNSSNVVSYRASKVYFGVMGDLSCTLLHYPELNDQSLKPVLSTEIGTFLEWRFFDKVSLGLDALYSNRKASLSFDTPYLTSYSESAMTHISYVMSVKGVEFHAPITWYFGKPKLWLDSYSRYFVFAGPSFFLCLSGSMQWERKHLIDNQQIAFYQAPVAASTISPYDYGVLAGFGVIYKQKVRHYHFVAKGSLSFYYGLSDTFSIAEKNLSVLHFYGLGDIQHEVLGTRYFRQIKMSFAFAIPFRDKPAAACRDFGIY